MKIGINYSFHSLAVLSRTTTYVNKGKQQHDNSNLKGDNFIDLNEDLSMTSVKQHKQDLGHSLGISDALVER